MAKHRIYTTSFASVYPHYLAKAEKKGRTKAESDQIIRWLTGYDQEALQTILDMRTGIHGAKSPIRPLPPAARHVRTSLRSQTRQSPFLKVLGLCCGHSHTVRCLRASW